jgi:hypothetical protein
MELNYQSIGTHHMASKDEDKGEGRYERFTHRRIDKLMRDVEHLQFQTDALLSRCRFLHYQLRTAFAVAGLLMLRALGADWWWAIGLPVALVIWDAIINTRHERKADKILEKKLVLPEDFDDYAEAEKRLQEELAEINKTSFFTPATRPVDWSVMRR